MSLISFQYTEKRIKVFTILMSFGIYLISSLSTIAVFVLFAVKHGWPKVSFFNHVPYESRAAIYVTR